MDKSHLWISPRWSKQRLNRSEPRDRPEKRLVGIVGGRPRKRALVVFFFGFFGFGLGWYNHDNHDYDDDGDDDGDDDDVKRRFKHCAGCSLARYCGQLCQHKVETKAYFQFSTNPTLYLGSHLFQKRLCWGKIHKWSRNFLLNTQGTVVKNKKIKTNNLWSVWQ